MTLPLVVALTPAPDPAAALVAVADLPYPCFLDSAGAGAAGAFEEHGQLGRYSFICADPVQVVRGEGDGLAEAMRLLERHRAPRIPGLPPFQGGLAGYIAYDWGGRLERIPPTRFDDLQVPDVVFGLYEWVVAWDHARGEAWIFAQRQEQIEMVRERLHGVTLTRSAAKDLSPDGAIARYAQDESRVAGPAAPSYPVSALPAAEAIGLRSTFTHRGYLNAVARVREYILAGDIFQANLSQRFEAPLREDPLALYLRLRRRNPAPFAAYLDAGDLQVLSASPERYLKLDGDQVETRPIKGTRPRGLGPMHDAALGQALAESEKDRAENVMIVDLLRNDLSRVSEPGTVGVPALFALEHHPTVHHLVSTVTGRLRPGAGAEELLRATFPGGSITGAPKVRAMEIIAELEPTRRGVYCGSIGYVGWDGAMDTSIVIRTYVVRGGRVYFQAGGGIVADSEPESEYRETLDKARGLIEALVG
jgi:para-aminobenzoate synthetase component 1